MGSLLNSNLAIKLGNALDAPAIFYAAVLIALVSLSRRYSSRMSEAREPLLPDSCLTSAWNKSSLCIVSDLIQIDRVSDRLLTGLLFIISSKRQ